MKGKMNLKHRKNIVREAKRMIDQEIKEYGSKPIGQQESILDEYIEKVCVNQGWSMSHFYCEDGRVLNKILK
jgi:hypothetical protein